MKSIYPGIVVSVLALTSCVSAPGTNRKQLNFLPESQMNAMGEEAYKEMLSQSKMSQNGSLNSEIVEVGRRIAQASGVNYEWEFSVIDDAQANAFCLPGGKVGVYTGLIPIAKNNAGLAAVLGHEVAHAVLRHSAERMSQQYILQAGMVLTDLTFANSKYRNIIAASMGIGAQFGVSLPFSRYHEAEADRIGLEYMAKAGYDPQEAVLLWQRMGQAGGARPPEILSTHPDPTNRAKDLSKQMGKAMQLYNASQKQATKNL